MATRLACVADEDLHRRLRAGVTVNGLTDLHDILEYWGDAFRSDGQSDGTVTEEEMRALLDFDAFLEERFWSRPGFPDTEEWSWLFAREAPLPQSWRETVTLARATLHRFTDFDLQRWREAGCRVW